MRMVLLPASAVLLSSAAALAQVTILSQNAELVGEVHVGTFHGETLNQTQSFSHTLTDLNSRPSMYDWTMLHFVGAQASIDHSSHLPEAEFFFSSTLSSTFNPNWEEQRTGVGGSGHHSVQIQFRVDEPVQYTFNASVTHGAGSGVTELSLQGEGIDLSVSSHDVASISAGGLLMPGVYTLSGSGAHSFAHDDISTSLIERQSSFLASFEFVPGAVPAPGAAFVLALGAGLAVRRRR